MSVEYNQLVEIYMNKPKLIIIYDTYCGWCYGAAPIFDALVDADVELEVLHRHLFQGMHSYKLADGKGELILKADATIASLTGQVFSQKYIDNVVLSKHEVLFSSYSAQAAALMHGRGVEAEFAIRRRLESARYIDGVSAMDRGAVVEALKKEGVTSLQAERIGTPELVKRADEIASRALYLMRLVGSKGVPTLIKVKGNSLELLDHTSCYGNLGNIAALINQ